MAEANTSVGLREVWPDRLPETERSINSGWPYMGRCFSRVIRMYDDARAVGNEISTSILDSSPSPSVFPTSVPDGSQIEMRRSKMRESLPKVTERIEAAGVEPLHAVASDELRSRLGLRLERINGTMVSIAADVPSIVLNRAIGLGLAEPATADGIERISAAYRDHGIDNFYVGVHPEARPDGIEKLLENAGLESGRRWMKFERGPDPAPTAESNLEVRDIGEEHADEFGRIAASGFGLTPEAARLFRGLIDRRGHHLYMSFDDDTPAGTGLVYIDGKFAWFDWAATDPEFRQRGSQRALLARRIQTAVDAGCTRLMTCTGEAVPGDPQHSYHNIEWAGFEPKFLRENWVPK